MLTGQTPQGTRLRPVSGTNGRDSLNTVVMAGASLSPSSPLPLPTPPPPPLITTEDSALPSYTSVLRMVSIFPGVRATCQ